MILPFLVSFGFETALRLIKISRTIFSTYKLCYFQQQMNYTMCKAIQIDHRVLSYMSCFVDDQAGRAVIKSLPRATVYTLY